MLDAQGNPAYRPHPVLARSLDILLTLHAEHEMNCSTAAVRHLASSGVDVYTATAGAFTSLLWSPYWVHARCIPRPTHAIIAQATGCCTCVPLCAAGIGALYGPLHGGANEAVIRMLIRIKDPANIPAFLEGVKAKKEKLFGFGHRVYKNFDPRAKLIQQLAGDVRRYQCFPQPLKYI